MAAIPKRSGKPSVSGPADRRAPTVGIIVKRGALRRFDRLSKAVGELPVELTWDRRTNSDRRATSRPGQVERRKAPPSTWETADFVVVEPLESTAPPATDDTEMVAAGPKSDERS